MQLGGHFWLAAAYELSENSKLPENRGDIMSAWINEDTYLRRREFIDYIFGLIRYEIHQGEDNDKRLEVLSKIYHDLLYVENLEQAEGWQRKVKGKDDLTLALEKIQKLTEELAETKAKLNGVLSSIDDKMTKRK